MPVILPRRGRGGGGPGRRGGRDGGRGRGGRGGPLPCHERNPMLASNSRNSTLATSISPLPRTPALSAAVPPPPPAVAGPQYATAVVQVQDCGNPRVANPSSSGTAASRAKISRPLNALLHRRGRSRRPSPLTLRCHRAVHCPHR
jgi:hypothetical protein